MKDLLKLFKYQNPVDDFEAIRIGKIDMTTRISTSVKPARPLF